VCDVGLTIIEQMCLPVPFSGYLWNRAHGIDDPQIQDVRN
jgi:hypothetical protein